MYEDCEGDDVLLDAMVGILKHKFGSAGAVCESYEGDYLDKLRYKC